MDRAPSSPQPRATLHVQSSPPSQVRREWSRPTSGTGDFQVEESSAASSWLARPPHPTRSWISMPGILPVSSGVVSIIIRALFCLQPSTVSPPPMSGGVEMLIHTRHEARKPRRSTKHWSSYEVPEGGTRFRSSPPWWAVLPQHSLVSGLHGPVDSMHDTIARAERGPRC